MEKQVTGIQIQFPEDNRPLSQKMAEFLDTTVGRDKIFRLFQYYVKFILPFIKNKEKLAKLVGFFESFSALCGLTRKMLRIGRYVNAYRNISARLNKKPEDREYNDVIRSLSDASNAIYFVLDHILLVSKLNVFKMDPKFVTSVDWYSNFAWGSEAVFNLIYDLVDYYHIDANIRKSKCDLEKIENADSIEFKCLLEKTNKLKHEQFRKMLDILRCALDLPLILHFLTSDKVVSNTTAGFFGIITSLIGCYQKWAK